MYELLTYGDIILEASLDDITPEQFIAEEHPSRFERVDWANHRPSMQYLQKQFDEWTERLTKSQNELAVIRRWHLEVPEQLQRCVDAAKKQQNKWYNLLKRISVTYV